jgi:hypothetical protein
MPLHNPFVPEAGANIRYSDPDTLAVDESIIPRATDTYDLGSSTKLWRKGYLSELEAVLFAENTITLLGGWFYVTKDAGTLGADVAALDTAIDFGKAMTVGHFVVMRASLKVEYVQVGTLVTGTTYNVTRNLDGTGANDWPSGTPFAVLGASGDGRIELDAYNTPRISLIQQGATYNAQTELIRMGDLNGGWGYVTETWGIAIGEYAASKPNITIDPTNGLRIRHHTTDVIKLDTSGVASFENVIKLGTSGELRQGTGALGTDFTGLRIWRESGIGRIGGYNANVLQWYAGTDGKMYAGGGKVSLGSEGIRVQAATAWDAERAYGLVSGSTPVGGLGGSLDSTNAGLQLRSEAVADRDTVAILSATSPSNRYATMRMFATRGGDTHATMGVVSDGASGRRYAYVDRDLDVYWGLNVGTATGAGAGQVRASGSVYPGNDVQYFLGLSGSSPVISCDANDYIAYNRTANRWEFFIGGTVVGYIDSGGFKNGAPP